MSGTFSDVQNSIMEDASDFHLPGLTFDLVRAEFSLSVNDPENVRLLIRHIQILLQRHLTDGMTLLLA